MATEMAINISRDEASDLIWFLGKASETEQAKYQKYAERDWRNTANLCLERHLRIEDVINRLCDALIKMDKSEAAA